MSRSPPSTLFQDLYNAALRDYENQSGTKLVEHPLAKQLEKCDSAESMAIVLQEQAHKFLKLRGNDGKIMKFLKSSVDVLYPLFNSPIFFQVIGLVPFPPANAIFTAIAVLLAAIKDIGASYDELVIIFSSFENFLSRLSNYIGVRPTPALTNILVKTIQELLSILALATNEVKQGRFKKFMKKIRGENSEKDIEVALQRLDRLSVHEGLAAGAQALQIASKMKSDDVRQKIREWLSPPDPWKNHNTFREARHNKTGKWLIQGNTYAKWKSSRSSSLLWIKGKLGAGKSVICSAVIEDIRALQKAGQASLAFFYCDFREDQKKDRRGLLSSLLVQLGKRSDAYSAKLSGFYKAHGRGSQHASDDELLSCLKDMLKLPGQATVFIVIDALDECPTTTDLLRPREKVLKLVKDLVNLKISNLRICVTSRPEADIESILGPLAFRAISLEGESGQVKDIAEYVKSVMNTDSEMRKWKDTDKQMVINVLSKKAGGMFRWVVCQLEILRLCIPRTKDIRRALNELPETLDETYARALERIDEKKWKYAHLFFQCVAVASRPLRVEELAQFLSFDFEAKSTPTFQAGWRPKDPTRTVLSMCSSLLAVVKPEGYDSPVVQFAHISVQEYLMSARLFKAKDKISRFHVSTTPAHTIVARACLGLLLHLDETITKDSLKNFPLAEYAAEYWVGHARIKDVSSKLHNGMKRLFDPSKSHLSIWVWICDPEYSSWNRPKRSKRPRKARATPLHYAAFYGLYDIAKFLIVKRLSEVNARGDKETPLHAASRRGHADIVQLLLKHGADRKAQDDDGRTPLHRASEYGQVEVARILLEHGADTETRDNLDGSPLERASMRGYVEFSRLLLKHGADANAIDNDGRTPLHLVSLVGRVGAARVLLENGADANARDADRATPLHLACYRTYNLEERLEVVRLLVQCGSDIHARDNRGQTPFMTATDQGNHGIMQLLLGYGAKDHRKR